MSALLVTPAEMQEFAKRAGVDLASCYLALATIERWGLTLDSARAAKLARGEANRSVRNEWSLGIRLEAAENLAAASSSSLDSAGADLRDRCRSALRDERLAPGQIENGDNDHSAALLSLKNQLKPRDRKVLEWLVQGLTVAEIAEKKGQTPAAIYACLARIKPLLADASARKEWEKTHNSLLIGTGDAPVILEKNQQLGWDLGVAA